MTVKYKDTNMVITQLNFKKDIVGFIGENYPHHKLTSLTKIGERQFRKMALTYAVPISIIEKDSVIEIDDEELIESSHDAQFLELDYEVHVSRISVNDDEYLLVEQITEDDHSNITLVRFVYQDENHVSVSIDLKEENVTISERFKIMATLLSI